MRSSASRSQPPESAAAAYVLWRKPSSTARVVGRSDHVVGEDELAQLGVVARRRRRDRCVAIAGVLGIRVGVEDAFVGAAGPVPRAAHLLRVRLEHHVRAAVRCPGGVRRRRATREPRGREIEGAPEQVHRARLAHECGAELGQDPARGGEQPPIARDLVGVVGRVGAVVGERHRVGDLHRDRPDVCVDAEPVELAQQVGVELGDRPRGERHGTTRAVGSVDDQLVRHEVEIDLEAGGVGRPHERRRQPACRHVERHVPPVVQQRRVRESDLADDLRPELQGVAASVPTPRRGARARRRRYVRACAAAPRRGPPASVGRRRRRFAAPARLGRSRHDAAHPTL